MKVTIVRSRSTHPSVKKIARALAKDGHDVELILWNRTGNPSPLAKEEYSTTEIRLRAPQDKVTVAPFLPFWWIRELFALLTRRSDVLHACDLDTLLPAIVVNQLRRAKLCSSV